MVESSLKVDRFPANRILKCLYKIAKSSYLIAKTVTLSVIVQQNMTWDVYG